MAFELVKLTQEEDTKLTLFVGKAVRKNLSFPVLTTRLMDANRLTIQDLFNASKETLQQIGKALRKMAADFDPEFSSTEVQKVGGVEISELIDIVKLIIKEKDYKVTVSALRKQKAALQANIAAAKTPEELRKENEALLATLPSDEELVDA